MRNWFFIVVLFLPSFALAQELIPAVDSSLYPTLSNLDFIPKSSNQAILKYVVRPNDSLSNSSVVLSVDIIPSLTRYPNLAFSSLGFVDTSTSTDTRTFYSVVDESSIYFRQVNSTFTRLLSSQIQNLLVSQGLGTVEQRAAYIAGFKVKNVNIIDTSSILSSFTTLLGPWANIAVGLMICLFALEFGTRNMKQVAGDAAKEVRKAESQALRDEIKNDKYAQVFRARMKYFAGASRDYLASAEFRRESREWLEQTALDYAKYKSNRGWTR